jgi:hypothetical protein
LRHSDRIGSLDRRSCEYFTDDGPVCAPAWYNWLFTWLVEAPTRLSTRV